VRGVGGSVVLVANPHTGGALRPASTGRLCFLSSGSRNEQINKHKDDVEKALGSWAAGIEVVL
jgi:hypothetical protein